MNDSNIYSETLVRSRNITYAAMAIFLFSFLILFIFYKPISIPNYATAPSKFLTRPEVSISNRDYNLFLFEKSDKHINIIVRKLAERDDEYNKMVTYETVFYNNSQYWVQLSSPVHFIVKRIETSEIIFEVQGEISFSDAKLRTCFRTPSEHIYGIDEESLYKRPDNKKYRLFDPKPSQNKRQSQGHFPMYLAKEKSRKYHVAYFENTKYQEVEISRDNQVNWDFQDDLFNLHMILGDESPEYALKSYREYFEAWQPPELWAFGFFQARELYTYLTLMDIVKTTAKFKLPLEGFITTINPDDDCKMPNIHRYIPAIEPFLKRNGIKLLPLVNSPRELTSIVDLYDFRYDCFIKQPICHNENLMTEILRKNINPKFHGAVLSNTFHVNLDSLDFGLLEESHGWIKNTFNQEFFISKTTIPQSIPTSSHWITNLDATWDSMREVLKRVLNFNIFGIPFVGGDVCGSFLSESRKQEPELCIRWYQLASFFPFIVSGYLANEEDRVYKELYTYHGDLNRWIARFLRERYNLVQQYHTFFLLNTNEMILKPVSFQFPDDPNFGIYGAKPNEEQFLIGNNIMVAPCLYPGVDEITVHFPENTTWFDARTFDRYNSTVAHGVSAKIYEVAPYFIREGSILFRQDLDELLTIRLNNFFDIFIAFPPLLLDPADSGKIELEGTIVNSVNQTELVYPKLNSFLNRMSVTVDKENLEKYLNVTIEFSSGSFPIQFQKITFLATDPKFGRYSDVISPEIKDLKAFSRGHMIRLEMSPQNGIDKAAYNFVFRKISI